MRTLSKLVTREILANYVFNVAVVTLLTTLAISNQFLRENIELSDILKLLPNILISTFTFSLPMASIITCTQISSLWKSEGEILAISSAGLPLNVIHAPAIYIFILLAFLTLPLNHAWIPDARKELVESSNQMLRKVLIARARNGLPLVLPNHDRLFNQGVAGGWLNKIIFTQHDAKLDTTLILKADRGRIIFEDDESLLDCRQVQVIRLDKEKNQSFSISKYKVPLKIRKKNIKNISDYEALSSLKLGASTGAQLELQKRWLFSFIIPLMAWLGLKLGLLIPGTNQLVGFIFSLLPVALFIMTLLYISGMIQVEVGSQGWPAETIWFSAFLLIILGRLLSRQIKASGY